MQFGQWLGLQTLHLKSPLRDKPLTVAPLSLWQPESESVPKAHERCR